MAEQEMNWGTMNLEQKNKLITNLCNRAYKMETDLKRTMDTLKRHVIWTRDQLKAINSALDRLDAPPTQEESPALEEIRKSIKRIDKDLDQVWEEVFPKPNQGSSGYTPSAPRM